MTPELQKVIVDRHNYFRNQVAGGTISGFQGVTLPTAVRMASIRWNDQLAHFASLNAMQCVYAHDNCRSSPAFNWAGQNLAIQMTPDSETSRSFVISEYLLNMIGLWFNEHAFARVSDINKFTTLNNGNEQIGHFTALTNELQTDVGCAVVHYDNQGWRAHYMICNYAFTNMLNFPVYRSGTVGSQCTTGRNPLYPNLCSVNEKINPNPKFENA
jgi:hypothetical protein